MNNHEFTYTEERFPAVYYRKFFTFVDHSRSNIKRDKYYKYKIYKDQKLVTTCTYKTEYYMSGIIENDIYNKIGGPKEPKYAIKKNTNGKFALDIKEEYVSLNIDGTISFVYTPYEAPLLNTYEEVKQLINEKEKSDLNKARDNDWIIIAYGNFPLP